MDDYWKNLIKRTRHWQYQEYGREEGKVDCLGYVLFICKDRGYNLPDWEYASGWEENGKNYFVDEIYKIADEVERNCLKPGDLLLFKNWPNMPNHIAVFVGDGKFTQCVFSGVSVNNLSDQPYNRRFYRAFRLKDKSQ